MTARIQSYAKLCQGIHYRKNHKKNFYLFSKEAVRVIIITERVA